MGPHKAHAAASAAAPAAAQGADAEDAEDAEDAQDAEDAEDADWPGRDASPRELALLELVRSELGVSAHDVAELHHGLALAGFGAEDEERTSLGPWRAGAASLVSAARHVLWAVAVAQVVVLFLDGVRSVQSLVAAELAAQLASGPSGSQLRDELERAASAHERGLLVREAFRHAWGGYKQFAWGRDTLHPVSRTGSDDFLHMSISVVDAMDTAWLMGEREIFEEQYAFVVRSVRFAHQEDINLFETTIRVVGGLLSAFCLSQRRPLLQLAEDLGRRLLPAFDSPTGLPYGTLGLRSGKRYNPTWVQGASTLAEAGTLTLEFRMLSFLTGDPAFAEAVDRAMRFIERAADTPAAVDGLLPMFLHPDTGQPSGAVLTLGARGDSLYEYLLKAHLQSDRSEPWLRRLYDNAVAGALKHLVRNTTRGRQLTYVAEMDRESRQHKPKMDHLVCFMPGMLALGAIGQRPTPALSHQHTEIAKRLLHTCRLMYDTPSGLAPEIVQLDAGLDDMVPMPDAKHSLLRPETLESLFVLWRLTKDPVYREWGWEIFKAISSHARVRTGGFSGVKDVMATPVQWNDKMDSFFLAETLKYAFLLFADDDLLPLDKVVFNTEAHPLPVFSEAAHLRRQQPA